MVMFVIVKGVIAKCVITKYIIIEFVIINFVMTKRVITKYVINKFVIIKYVIIKFVITEFQCIQITKSKKFLRFTMLNLSRKTYACLKNFLFGELVNKTRELLRLSLKSRLILFFEFFVEEKEAILIRL